MFDTTLFILLGLAALGFISHNTTVAISILVLIIVRVTPLNVFFPWIEKQGAEHRYHHSDHRRDGSHRQRNVTALDADSLFRQLEVTAGDCRGRVRLVAWRTRSRAHGFAASTGRRAAGGYRAGRWR